MITAIDSNVLLDIFLDDQSFRSDSIAALRACLADGPIIACDVVFAEVTAVFADDSSRAPPRCGRVPVTYAPLDENAAVLAGTAWRRYRRESGPRERVIADFLVGAHALTQADRLLTRDRGFGRGAFEGLIVVDPTAR